MKYLIFFTMLFAGVPFMAVMAMSGRMWREWLFGLMIFTNTLGASAAINFYSLETYRGPDRGFQVTLPDLIALALLLALLMKFPGRIKLLPWNWPLLFLYFLMCLISLVPAPNRIVGWFTIFKLARFFLLYVTTYNCLHLGVRPAALRWALTAVGIYIFLTAFQQKYVVGLYRVNGPFDHSNTIPLFCNLVIPVLLLWGLCEPGIGRAAAGLAVFASLGMVFAVVATFSRAGTGLAGMILMGALVLANIRHRSTRVKFVSALAGLALLGGGIKVAGSFLDRIENAPEASEHAREEFNLSASMMAHDHRLGVGINNFSHVLTYTPEYRAHIVTMANEEQAGVCHHIYWLTAAELGYGGAAVFVLMLGRFVLRMGVLGLRGKSWHATVLVGFLLGMLALHASGFLEWAFRITPVFYQFGFMSAAAMWFGDCVQGELDQKRGGRLAA